MYIFDLSCLEAHAPLHLCVQRGEEIVSQCPITPVVQDGHIVSLETGEAWEIPAISDTDLLQLRGRDSTVLMSCNAIMAFRHQHVTPAPVPVSELSSPE